MLDFSERFEDNIHMHFTADDLLGRRFAYADDRTKFVTVCNWGRVKRVAGVDKFLPQTMLRGSDGSVTWFTMSEFASLVRNGILEVA